MKDNNKQSMKIDQDIKQLIQKCPLLILSICGGLAACTAEVFTFPFDNLKTRMQMNGKQGMPNYSSLGNCIKTTLKLNGIKGFFKGVNAALIRQSPYSSSRMFVYEYMKRYIFKTDQPNYFQKLFAGGFCGAIGCLVGTPGDILKIRLINDLNSTKYSGIVDCWQQAIKDNGYRSLLKGLNINIIRAIVVNACELATYDQAKDYFVNSLQMAPDSILTFLYSSLVAGLVASLASSPVDVCKTRYMNQFKENNHNQEMYKNALDCVRSIYNKEGFIAFYKGFWPYYFRCGPWAVIFFVTYEKYKEIVIPNIVKL